MSRERLHQRQRRNLGRVGSGHVLVAFIMMARSRRRHRALVEKYRAGLERIDREAARLLFGERL